MIIIERKSVLEVRQDNGFIHPSGFGAVLFTQGKGVVTCNDVAYDVEPCVMLVLTPYRPMRIEECSDNLEGMLLEADVSTTMALLDDVAAEKRLALAQMPCVKITLRQSAFILKLLDIIKEKKAENLNAAYGHTEIGERIMMLLAQSLCLQIIDIYGASTLVKGEPLRRSSLIYNKFISSVYSHCHLQRSVTFYAEQQNMSTGHFSAVVKKVSGRSPLYWIEVFTMTKIRKLLSDRSLSMKEIANQMNFPDASTFSRYFKQREYLTPNEFRDAPNNKGADL